MPKNLSVVLLSICSFAVGQSTATVPAVCEGLPGNAAVAMPLRWSEGTLQVFVDPGLLPPNFAGASISGLQLRRSVLPGDVAYPAISRTLTVRGGFQSGVAATAGAGLTQNRPAGHQLLFGPAVVQVPATPAPGPDTTVGDAFVQITFSTPLVVTPGTLFLELQVSDGPLTISSGHWVDAVWFEDGVDEGLVVQVGDGSCTTRSEPTELAYTGSSGPVAGSSLALAVSGVPPTNVFTGETGFVVAWAGVDPASRPPGLGYLGFGAGLGGLDPTMTACHQWAPLDFSWFGTSDAAGRFATSLTVPGSAAVGARLGLQAAWLDVSRPSLPLSLSNGLQLVCSGAGVGSGCSSCFFPGAATSSPWGPQIGQMPVLLLDY
ncbi:MAG: hypothetical protein ACON4Z_13095 [Planctomycetota bacterium]